MSVSVCVLLLIASPDKARPQTDSTAPTAMQAIFDMAGAAKAVPERYPAAAEKEEEKEEEITDESNPNCHHGEANVPGDSEANVPVGPAALGDPETPGTTAAAAVPAAAAAATTPRGRSNYDQHYKPAQPASGDACSMGCPGLGVPFSTAFFFFFTD